MVPACCHVQRIVPASPRKVSTGSLGPVDMSVLEQLATKAMV